MVVKATRAWFAAVLLLVSAQPSEAQVAKLDKIPRVGFLHGASVARPGWIEERPPRVGGWQAEAPPPTQAAKPERRVRIASRPVREVAPRAEDVSEAAR